MKVNVWRARSLLLVGVLLLGASVAAALVYRALWLRYDNALLQLEPRIERLEGVVNAGNQIEELLGTASSTVAPLLHPGGEAAQNDVQQKLRQMIMASGSTLVSLQVASEPGGEDKIPRIRLTATVSG